MTKNFDRPVTAAEYHLYDWQHKRAGGFITTLFNAMMQADETNLNKLAQGFPEHVQAYKYFARRPGYWEWLEAAIASERYG